MKVFLSVCLFILIISQPLYSQKLWSLSECIDYAKNINLTLQESELNIQNNIINYQQAKNNRLPNINGSVSHNYSLGRSIDPFSNTFVTQTIRSNNFNINVSYTLFNGFKLKNNVYRADIVLQNSKLNAEVALNMLIVNIITSYLNVLLNEQQIEVFMHQLKNSDLEVTRTESFVIAGALPKVDLLDLQNQKKLVELNIIDAQNSLHSSLLNLKQILQVPDSVEFNVDKPKKIIIDTTEQIFTLGYVFEKAVDNLARIKVARLGLIQSKIDVKIAKADLYPIMNINGNFNTRYSSAQKTRTFFTSSSQTVETGFVPTDPNSPILTDDAQRVFSVINVQNLQNESFKFFNQLEEGFSQFIGLSINIPIFNGWAIKNNIKQTELTVDLAKINIQREELKLKNEIEQALLALEITKKRYITQLRRLDIQESLYKNEQVRYESGASNITNLTTTQNNYYIGLSNLARAEYNFLFNKLIIKYYIGEEITF